MTALTREILEGIMPGEEARDDTIAPPGSQTNHPSYVASQKRQSEITTRRFIELAHDPEVRFCAVSSNSAGVVPADARGMQMSTHYQARKARHARRNDAG